MEQAQGSLEGLQPFRKEVVEVHQYAVDRQGPQEAGEGRQLPRGGGVPGDQPGRPAVVPGPHVRCPGAPRPHRAQPGAGLQQVPGLRLPQLVQVPGQRHVPEELDAPGRVGPPGPPARRPPARGRRQLAQGQHRQARRDIPEDVGPAQGVGGRLPGGGVRAAAGQADRVPGPLHDSLRVGQRGRQGGGEGGGQGRRPVRVLDEQDAPDPRHHDP
mmetsp:Transcript_39486/g.111701  ORF Transcript_39486/g.111701 Transcript_39486/m.111701 type:complete len:214 (-) Transcript_39486:131-772(-)